jgi:hypothetical protein
VSIVCGIADLVRAASGRGHRNNDSGHWLNDDGARAAGQQTQAVAVPQQQIM